jgi:hypothetical protein
MFSNLKTLKVKSGLHLKMGDVVEAEGISLIIFGHSKGFYLAWSGPGSTIYRIE